MVAIQIPNRLVDKLQSELATAGSREIGGILMGEQITPGEFRVLEMTFQRHGGKIALFVRNARMALLALQKFFTRTEHRYHRYNYLGEWHSHPSFEARPSSKDHQTNSHHEPDGSAAAVYHPSPHKRAAPQPDQTHDM